MANCNSYPSEILELTYNAKMDALEKQKAKLKQSEAANLDVLIAKVNDQLNQTNRYLKTLLHGECF